MIKRQHSFLCCHFPHAVNRPCVEFEATPILKADFDELKGRDEYGLSGASHGPDEPGLERCEAVESEELFKNKAPLLVRAEFDGPFGCLGNEWREDTAIKAEDTLASDDSL